MSCCLLLKGKSSKVFLDELGFVGREEIIHRNNICLLSIIQNLDSDTPQDGTPFMSADDEQSPVKLQPTHYGGMTHQTGIPGLSHTGWPPQQQQQQQQQSTEHNWYQDGYGTAPNPTSNPMQPKQGHIVNGGEHMQQ